MRLLPFPVPITADQEIAACIAMRKQWTCYKTVLLFLSMKDEIDTEPLIKAVFEDKKSVFVPKIIKNSLHFFRITDLNGLEIGAFNIREPRSGVELTDQDFPACIVTPGLAFDRNGRRLGRGKGYYDRFFAEIDRKNLPYVSIGLCSAEHVVDEVPFQAFDKKVDVVIVVDSVEKF